MSVLTKEEVESLLAAALEENEGLSRINRELIRENSELLLIVADATDKIKVSNDTAENYQNMFNQLVGIIKDQYDAEFNAEEIPKRLS